MISGVRRRWGVSVMLVLIRVQKFWRTWKVVFRVGSRWSWGLLVWLGVGLKMVGNGVSGSRKVSRKNMGVVLFWRARPRSHLVMVQSM